LNAELDAELYTADPKNAGEVARMAAEQTTGFPPKIMWMALYGQYPATAGGSPGRNSYPFIFTPASRDLIGRATTFLYKIKGINVPQLRPEAIMPDFAEQILQERKLSTPAAEVKAMPISAYPGT